jgi:hypothetical protein
VVVAELLQMQKQELITHQATVLREQDARNKKGQTTVMNIKSQQTHST